MIFDPPNDEEKDRFYLGDFPQSSSRIKEYLFIRTGFSAARPLGMRGWFLFNTGMNKGFNLGLDEHTIKVLSLLDHSLAEVTRFAGEPHMHEIKADSTAAHSKQLMRIVHDVIAQTFPDHIPPAIEKFRKKAVLGGWVHDMGEMVVELTTAHDFFNMSKEEQAEVSRAKNDFERELFAFGIDMAEYFINQGTPEQFPEEIRKLRQVALNNTTTLERIDGLQTAMRIKRDELGIAEASVTPRLLDVYDKAEEPAQNNFLYPFVKTLEATEGQRYFQLNSGTEYYTRQELSTSHHVVGGIRRIERRLPELFEMADAQPDGEKANYEKLAVAAASFTYGSIVRQFMPVDDKPVSLAPPYILRSSEVGEEVRTDYIIPEHREAARAEWHRVLEKRHTEQDDGLDKPIWSREEAGAVYRAAQAAVARQPRGFRPKTSCLISDTDTPKIPDALLKEIARQKMEESSTRRSSQETSSSKRGRA